MKDRIRKICFAVFCVIFLSLVIFSAVRAEKTQRPEQSGASSKLSLSGTPEVRAGSLYFNRLDVRGQLAYDAIYAAVKKENKYTELLPFVMTEAELFRAVNALLFDMPQIYCINTESFDLKSHSYTKEGKKSGELVILPSVENGCTRIWIPYTANNEDNSKFLEKADARFKASLKKADSITETVKDQFLVCQLIHDYLSDICEKTEDGGIYANSAYGALVEGRATSLGYAKAFKLLYERYSGVSYIIEGDGRYYNVALIDDKYYNIDAFSDDLDGCVNGEEARGVFSHSYLCLDDETFYSGFEKTSDAAPSCFDKTNYYTHNDLDAQTESEVVEILKKQAEARIKTKSRFLEIYCESSDAKTLISSALGGLKELYPDYFNTYKIYQPSEKISAFVIQLIKTETNEAVDES